MYSAFSALLDTVAPRLYYFSYVSNVYRPLTIYSYPWALLVPSVFYFSSTPLKNSFISHSDLTHFDTQRITWLLSDFIIFD